MVKNNAFFNSPSYFGALFGIIFMYLSWAGGSGGYIVADGIAVGLIVYSSVKLHRFLCATKHNNHHSWVIMQMINMIVFSIAIGYVFGIVLGMFLDFAPTMSGHLALGAAGIASLFVEDQMEQVVRRKKVHARRAARKQPRAASRKKTTRKRKRRRR